MRNMVRHTDPSARTYCLPDHEIGARGRSGRRGKDRYDPPELTSNHRGTQLLESLGLDLPNAFPGDPEDLADLFEGLGLAVLETESHSDDVGLLPGQCGQRLPHGSFGFGGYQLALGTGE